MKIKAIDKDFDFKITVRSKQIHKYDLLCPRKASNMSLIRPLHLDCQEAFNLLSWVKVDQIIDN